MPAFHLKISRRVSGTSGEFAPEKQIARGDEHIARLALLGCETVRRLAELDQKASGVDKT